MSVYEKMTALADAIRSKRHISDKLSLDGMVEEINRISYKRYTGSVASTVLGTGAYAVLVTDSELAAIRNEDNLTVKVRFQPTEEAPYTILGCIGFNTFGGNVTGYIDNYQQVRRCGATVDDITGSYPITPVCSDEPCAIVGTMCITSDGELRVYSNSISNYAIRPGTFTVEMIW